MRTRRWFWPGILALPAGGLIATEIVTLPGVHVVDDTRAGAVRALLGWGLWVALPFLVVIATMVVAVHRSRPAWWLCIGNAALVTFLGLFFWTASRTYTSNDPLVGLYLVLGPPVALVAALVVGLVAVVLSLAAGLDRSRQGAAVG